MQKEKGKKHSTRRQFIKSSAAAAGGILGMPYFITSNALGAPGRAAASKRLTVGVIGYGGRSRKVTEAFLNEPDTQVLAICDVNNERKLSGKKAVDDFYGNQDCATYMDMHEMLARDDIDTVLIATGDNWHSGMSMVVARAGKDMYCEKPLSVTVNESRAVADTMKRLGRVFQCGTQRRSIGHFIFAANLALSGKLGKIKELHAEQSLSFQEVYQTILPAQPEPAKEQFWWNRWLGPAQWRPYNEQYWQRRYWGAHLDFAGGSITEWGSHTADLCQWAGNKDHTSPVEYWREGDRYIGRYDDGVKLIFRTGLRFGTCPVKFVGEEGWVETGDSGQMEVYPKSLLSEKKFAGGHPPNNHVRAFLDCVKTRQQTIANAEVAHRSISSCHIANICKRLDRPIKWDPVKEQVIGDDEANRLTTRAYREPWLI
jgi:predicted dehydrogenase